MRRLYVYLDNRVLNRVQALVHFLHLPFSASVWPYAISCVHKYRKFTAAHHCCILPRILKRYKSGQRLAPEHFE